MPKYTLMDDVGNTVCAMDDDDPDEALAKASRDLGKPLTFDGDGRAPYLLLPVAQTSNLEGDPVLIEPERVVYVAASNRG